MHRAGKGRTADQWIHYRIKDQDSKQTLSPEPPTEPALSSALSSSMPGRFTNHWAVRVAESNKSRRWREDQESWASVMVSPCFARSAGQSTHFSYYITYYYNILYYRIWWTGDELALESDERDRAFWAWFCEPTSLGASACNETSRKNASKGQGSYCSWDTWKKPFSENWPNRLVHFISEVHAFQNKPAKECGSSSRQKVET